jgi:predicted nucleic acid-binding protein
LKAFDFDSALRWARKFGSRTIARRPNEQLPWISFETAPDFILLDTSVYIDRIQGNLPEFLVDVIDIKIANHSSVALQELMILVGALSRSDSRTATALKSVSGIVSSMNRRRLHAPDASVAAHAGLLAGTLARIQGYGKEHRFRAVNDCTLFLQSQKLGTTLLSRNYADFDILLQMMPEGRVAFY